MDNCLETLCTRYSSKSLPKQICPNPNQILARFRLVAEYGGDPNITTNVTILNDTGSNAQTIFRADLHNLLYNPQTYQGYRGVVRVTTAGGVVLREQIEIEMQVLKADGTGVSPWFREIGLVAPQALQFRLSGNAMRNHLYFATSPGNGILFVARKKNGIMAQLPVV